MEGRSKRAVSVSKTKRKIVDTKTNQQRPIEVNEVKDDEEPASKTSSNTVNEPPAKETMEGGDDPNIPNKKIKLDVNASTPLASCAKELIDQNEEDIVDLDYSPVRSETGQDSALSHIVELEDELAASGSGQMNNFSNIELEDMDTMELDCTMGPKNSSPSASVSGQNNVFPHIIELEDTPPASVSEQNDAPPQICEPEDIPPAPVAEQINAVGVIADLEDAAPAPNNEEREEEPSPAPNEDWGLRLIHTFTPQRPYNPLSNPVGYLRPTSNETDKDPAPKN